MRVFTNLHFLTLYTVVYDNAQGDVTNFISHMCADHLWKNG